MLCRKSWRQLYGRHTSKAQTTSRSSVGCGCCINDASACYLSRRRHQRNDRATSVPVLTGPTIAGCTYHSSSRSYERSTNGSDIVTPNLTLKFNSTLLAGDTIQVQDFNTNMTTWSGVDSLTLMVCGSAAPPPQAHPDVCREVRGSWHCSIGLISQTSSRAARKVVRSQCRSEPRRV